MSEARGREPGPLLAVEDLRITFAGLPAVDGVSFDVARSEVLGLVGESGCGKSVSALAILGLIPKPPGRIAGGRIHFEGRDLLALPEAELERIRGAEIAMIFQEPMTALNPVFAVGDQIVETLRRHQGLGRAQARRQAVDLLARVGIPSPHSRVDEFPHQLSGGMRQRVMIAIAIACNPKLLLADEPTTALDVTIQAQILELLADLQAEFRMSVILITHDLGVVAQFAHRVVVMYAGKVVEKAGVEAIFDRPLHPYTAGLLASMPDLEVARRRLQAIPGMVPPPFDLPPGCRFEPRCRFGRPACRISLPPLRELAASHAAACIRHTGYDPAGPVALAPLEEP